MKSMKMIKKAQTGFTLIELMIVVAIIGILAAVAIPQYQNYVIRAKLSTVLSQVDPVKLAVAEYSQENGGTIALGSADNWTSVGLSTPTASANVSSIGLGSDGKITANLTGIGSTYTTITWLPVVSLTATSLSWTVSCTTSDANFIKVLGPC